MDFSPDSQLVAAVSSSDHELPDDRSRNRITVWSTETGEELCTLVSSTTVHWFCAFAFSPDSQRIVTFSYCTGSTFMNRIQVWDSHAGRELAAFGCDLLDPDEAGINSIAQKRVRITFSPGGDHLYVVAEAHKWRPSQRWDYLSWSLPAEETDRKAGRPHSSHTTVILMIAGGLVVLTGGWVVARRFSRKTPAPAPHVAASTLTAALSQPQQPTTERFR
jgi:WD40 repeat protein